MIYSATTKEPVSNWILGVVAIAALNGAFFVDQLWFFALAGFIPAFFLIDNAVSRRAKYTAALLFCVIYAETLGFPFFSFSSINGIYLSSGIFFIARLGIFFYLLIAGVTAGTLLALVFLLTERRLLRLFLIPLVWVGFEYMLSYVNNGAQWGMIGESLVVFRLLRNFAMIGGAYSLSYLVLFSNAILYEYGGIHDMWRNAPKTAFFLIKPFFVACGVIAGFSLAGVFLEYFVPLPETKGGPVRILAVQTDYHGKWSPNYYQELQSSYMRVLEKSGKTERADVVILPSISTGILKESDISQAAVRASFHGVFERASAVIFGVSLVGNNKNIYSAVAMVNPEGLQAIRTKERLFFLSDYVPSFLRRLFPKFSQYTLQYRVSGDPHLQSLFNANDRPFAVLICNEGLIPEIARGAVSRGAEFLVVSGSDADFRSRFIYRETLRATRIRAVENGVYVVFAMRTGISAIIDPHGEIVDFIPEGQSGVLEFEIPGHI